MVLFPSGGLGRLLLAIIIITTISYLVLNLVSFGGPRWITYVDVPVRFGLWRVCDTRRSGLCNNWSSRFASNITNITFRATKPNFIQASQALEIISLIFYVLAAGLILLGIADLDVFPFEVAFILAAGLLFICIIFISATLGLMSDQGRNNHPLAFLDWAWWNGLVGLLMTIATCFTLIAFLAYLKFSSSSSSSSSSRRPPRPKEKMPRNLYTGGGVLNRSSSPKSGVVGSSLPIVPGTLLTNPPLDSSPFVTQYFQENSFNPHSQNTFLPYGGQNVSGPPINPYFQNASLPYSGQNVFEPPINPYFQNASLSYGGQNVFEPLIDPYFSAHSPSPIISGLMREYISQMSDTQYERQLLEPYTPYVEDLYFVDNNYL